MEIQDLRWWAETMDQAMVLSLIAAGIVAAAIAVTTRLSIKYNGAVREAEAVAFERYKADAGERAAKLEQETAQANERTALLEKEAAAANQRSAEIMKATAWRQFSPDQWAAMAKSLAGKAPKKFTLAWIANDAESLSLAVQFSNLFGSGKWTIEGSAKTFPNQLIWGISVPDSPDMTTTAELRAVLSAAGVPFSTEKLPQETMSFGTDDQNSAVILFGSKRPTLAQPPQ